MASTLVLSATSYAPEILQSRLPFSKRGGYLSEARERIEIASLGAG
jgi:hypothetical protein